MGDWSDYFEDYPEENPANWVNGRFDPALSENLIQRKGYKQQQIQDFMD